MNPKRLALAIVAAFVAIWATDFLIHTVWLDATYKATANLWRPEKEMMARMGWMVLAQFLAAAMFTIIYAKGFAAQACLRCACMYGLCMGLFNQTTTLVTFVVQPFPPALAVQWFIAGLVQGVLVGLIVHLTYKPAPAPPSPPG